MGSRVRTIWKRPPEQNISVWCNDVRDSVQNADTQVVCLSAQIRSWNIRIICGHAMDLRVRHMRMHI